MIDSAPTALVLDDHEIVLAGLARAFVHAGIEVVATTGSIEEARTLAAEHQPTLCIVDLRLRDRSGLDAIGPLKVAAPQTRVVVLTSFDDRRAARRAVELGASGFLIKDVTLEELCRQLRAVAEGTLVLDERVASAVVSPSLQLLTPREDAVLRLVAEGLTNREIAGRLHLSTHTVKEYLAKAMRKLGTDSRAATVAKAFHEHLLDPPPESPGAGSPGTGPTPRSPRR